MENGFKAGNRVKKTFQLGSSSLPRGIKASLGELKHLLGPLQVGAGVVCGKSGQSGSSTMKGL